MATASGAPTGGRDRRSTISSSASRGDGARQPAGPRPSSRGARRRAGDPPPAVEPPDRLTDDDILLRGDLTDTAQKGTGAQALSSSSAPARRKTATSARRRPQKPTTKNAQLSYGVPTLREGQDPQPLHHGRAPFCHQRQVGSRSSRPLGSRSAVTVASQRDCDDASCSRTRRSSACWGRGRERCGVGYALTSAAVQPARSGDGRQGRRGQARRGSEGAERGPEPTEQAGKISGDALVDVCAIRRQTGSLSRHRAVPAWSPREADIADEDLRTRKDRVATGRDRDFAEHDQAGSAP